ncbi:hypothetical protein [Ferruginibacter albus]|uniref:hypothetical protein n=1 Tax=Ferruginibacter albus TaxID=2875540 RepID=UPI001CC7C05A|nr:hypothetical protein [Ferruginibacter albus]UAY52146.1 hypothetical protein K9M53_00285 [Ferruginibacter albus]
MTKPLLALFSFVLFIPNLIHKDINEVLPYNGIEAYDPSLAYLNSISKLENYVDSVAEKKNIPINDNLAFMEVMANTIRERFYHGFSHYTLNENWIAAVSGKYIWYNLACIVNPEEIMKHDYAACSQQALVVISILRHKKIPYRTVLFPHHYALEININEHWYYFDTNLEPKIYGEQRSAEKWNDSNDSIKQYYTWLNRGNGWLDTTFGVHQKTQYGPVNNIPARHAKLFHLSTKIISKTAWLLPLLFIFFLERRQTKRADFSVE